jgi:diacylglycerol kinase family enzyme
VAHVLQQLIAVAEASAFKKENDSTIVLFANRFSGALTEARRLKLLSDALGQLLPPWPEGAEESRRHVVAPVERDEIPGELLRLGGILKEELRHPERSVLLLSVGGDGTHKSVLSLLVALPREQRQRVVVFRFPAGSSNDGPISRKPAEAARRLLVGTSPRSLKALEIETAPGRRELGFNIASIGIDAYTSIKNEQFRSLFGGNSYRGLANLAVLFYNTFHDPGRVNLEIETDQGEALSIEARVILLALGVSGRRTYGGGIPVLPEESNLCLVEHLGLAGKVLLKGRLLAGTHGDHPKVHLYMASRLAVSAERRMPIQIDGEVRWLEPEEWPLTMHLGREHINELY